MGLESPKRMRVKTTLISGFQRFHNSPPPTVFVFSLSLCLCFLPQPNHKTKFDSAKLPSSPKQNLADRRREDPISSGSEENSSPSFVFRW